MATINATITVMEDGVVLVKWLGITEADTGTPVNLARFPDRTVQVLGDFTTSGAITLEGSNDGTNYATLTDPQGDAIVITSQGLRLIAENPLYIRPRATAGSSVSMDVYIVGAPR
jgi:hypothetical protein